MSISKSAYSVAGKSGKIEKHTIVVWVDNEAGVLARVVGLFSGRGYNIDSLVVAEVDKKNNLSRITIVTSGTPRVIEQIKLQLKKLIPVHKVADFPKDKTLFRELALLKVVSSEQKRKKAIKICKKYNSLILDKTNKSFVVEVTALRKEIDKLINFLQPLGLASISRTGVVAMSKGFEVFGENK
jgi:acetolactate synthase-1/3 small subunit